MSSESSSKESSSKSGSFIPSELRISQKWDKAIETVLIKGATGFIVAGLASVVLFSKLKNLSFNSYYFG